MSRPALRNFGRNVSFAPQASYSPRSEDELLTILERHAGSRIRAVGSLHAWSPATETDGISIDLQHLNHVSTESSPDGKDHLVRVGAGCTIRRLLKRMQKQGGLTLPSLGLIQAQTVAGATATGTHGSGLNSMSHYVRAARVAVYDPATGQPTIRVVESGKELEAVRCSLGLLGVITELTLDARPLYRVREVFRVHRTLRTALEAETDYPIQQLYLIPWDWTYYGQHRVETKARSSFSAWLYRLYWIVVLDLGMHLVVRFLVRILRTRWGIQGFFRRLAGMFVVRNWSVVDRSDRQLTMNHDWFRHIEIELFVKRDALASAMEFVRDTMLLFGGEACPAVTSAALASVGLESRAHALKGVYTHHYPICIRKVMPDATLISMASGSDQPRYAISIISYARPDDRQSFSQVAAFLADAMGTLFAARPHWGKVCPVSADSVRRLYPRLDEFLEVRREFDPAGRFGNDWTDHIFAADP